ncbi:MAG: lipopolysaccharide heptosyltransferase I, partial [Gammaproteobacteria bacterium]|nr:lipopolysaccharide heptosyltransferase I [Gammaproteobacteria bacterium]
MRILIVKTSSMGDVIHTLPALTDAGKAQEDISFDWVVEEAFAEIPRWHKLVTNVLPIAMRRWRSKPLQALNQGNLRDLWYRLRSEKYDYIIDAQGLVKSAVIARLARGMRSGFDKASAREPLAALCYQHKFAVAKEQHAILRTRQLFAKALGYELPLVAPDYGLTIAATKPGNYLVFVHGTSRDDKCWPEENWMALAKQAVASGYDSIKIPWHGEIEEQRAKRIAAACDKVEILPKSNLTEIARVLAGAKAVVAVDTGLGHLAAALGAHTVSLYGPTDPELIGTVGR